MLRCPLVNSSTTSLCKATRRFLPFGLRSLSSLFRGLGASFSTSLGGAGSSALLKSELRNIKDVRLIGLFRGFLLAF